MFSTRRIERLAGALLVAGFVAFLGHVVTLLTLGAGLTTIRFVLIYGFLVILSAMALYLAFHPHERTLALFSAFGFAAHGLFIVLTSILLLAGFEFPEEFAVTFGAKTDSVVGAASALEATMDKIRTSAFIFLGLGVAPLGVLIAWSGAVARWLGWLGAVSGGLGFFGVLASLFDVVVGRLMFMSIIFLMFGFILILGVRLLVRETREATAGLSSKEATTFS